MKRFVLSLSLLATFLLLSMSEPAELPPELRSLKAKVVDAKGVVHNLSSFSCNNGATLKFKKGSVNYMLPITSIKRLEVIGAEDGGVKVKVTLSEGKQGEFSLSTSTRCKGMADMGSVAFYINEVKSIELSKGETK